MKARILALIIFVTAPPLAAETVYKWVDEEGRTHYSQEKPAARNARPVDVRPNLIPGLSPDELRQAREIEAKKPAPKAPPTPAPPSVPAPRIDEGTASAECRADPNCPKPGPPPDEPMGPGVPLQ